MQQAAQGLLEPNTAPRAVAGQFEDADDDGAEQQVIASSSKNLSQENSTTSKTHSLDDLKSSSIPPALQRRLSSNTNEATKALLAFAAAAGTAPPAQKKKKKTFVVRLEEIKEYNDRHGRVPRRDPVPSDEPWEQNLLSWVQECRKQFVDGTLSSEKAKALNELGVEGFRTDQELTRPEDHAHPALRALWMKRQQQEAQLMELRRASMGLAARRASLDPDGAIPTDEEVYPSDSLKHKAYPNVALSEMKLQEMQLQEAAVQSQRLALEEMQARETILAREALLREQLLREQRLAQAMAAQRRLSMGPFGGPQGRVMSLLQPLDSVPSRADPMSMSMSYSNDPRLNALLQAQLMQRRASLQAHESLLRRPSDASSNVGVVERRPSEIGSGSAMDLALKTWDDKMKDMFKFFRAHGHIQVPTRGEYQELGQWLVTTRSRLREGLLPAPMAKEFLAMEQLAVEGGGAAAKHVDEVARRNSVPMNAEKPDDRGLTTPTAQTKVKTFAAAPTSPTSSPKGKSKRALPKSWHQSFTELQAFKDKFGHCDVKMIVNSPYGLLGKWLASQRSRHKLGQLPIDKVNRLREMGCSGFDKGGRVPSRSQYRADDEEAEFDQAIRRLKENGAPASGDEEDPAEPCSPATREKRVRHSYETRVEHIKAFKEKHGHVKIRLGSSDKHEELLARWLASARSRYRGGQFKEERAAELRALGCDGFDLACDENTTSDMEEEAEVQSRKRDSPARTATPSPPPEDQDETSEPPSKKYRGHGRRQTFDDMLKELEEYQYVYGVGCSVPKPDGDKGKLGRWLAFQRRQFIAGKLSEERIEKLKSIGRKEFSKSALIVRAAERAAASIHMEQQ